MAGGSVSRRALLGGLRERSEGDDLASVDATPYDVDPSFAAPFDLVASEAPPVRRRPPGAVREEHFLQLCIACGDCAEACPHDAVHTLADWVEHGARTPVMQPDSRPCHMCAGFPCAAACQEGALRVPSSATWAMGTVAIAEDRCLPFLGPECGACAGTCPHGLDALRLERGRPSVDPVECVGCGLCIDACPVDPPAIVLMPLEQNAEPELA